MAGQFKDILEKIKAFWAKQSKKGKAIFLSALGGVLLLALGITLWLNRPSEYLELFPGMSGKEARQVYAILEEKNVEAQIDNQGRVMVRKDQWDNLVFELAGMGYPTTTLNYGTYFDNIGFTTTESQQRAIYLFQLQERMQQTLLQQQGIEDAVVSFNIPETSNYIWDQNNQEPSTAAITIKMREGYELSPERVQAVKNLAARSISNLEPENVTVVDGKTGVEVLGPEEQDNTYDVKKLEYERKIARELEDNVKRLLTPKYGADGVTAVAQVSLNYDKMKTEQKQLLPNENGKGSMTHVEESFTQEGEAGPVEGLVGEEYNTDIPKYGGENGVTGDGSNLQRYDSVADYDWGYIYTQTEKGSPILESVSMSVIVNDPEFDTEREELLVNLVSKAVNIPTANIRVTNLDFVAQPASTLPETPPAINWTLILIIAGAALFLLILLIVLIIVLVSRAKKKKLLKAQEEEQALLDEAEQRKLEMEREIAEHKMMLQNEALASTNAKEDAILEEVREFAEGNPEIAAALIRSLLKEGN